jgi:hypothetical protein
MFSLESVWPKRRVERVFVREINYLGNYIVSNISKRIDLESKNKASCGGLVKNQLLFDLVELWS